MPKNIIELHRLFEMQMNDNVPVILAGRLNLTHNTCGAFAERQLHRYTSTVIKEATPGVRAACKWYVCATEIPSIIGTGQSSMYNFHARCVKSSYTEMVIKCPYFVNLNCQ